MSWVIRAESGAHDVDGTRILDGSFVTIVGSEPPKGGKIVHIEGDKVHVWIAHVEIYDAKSLRVEPSE